MPNESMKKCHPYIYRSIEKGCLNCRLQRACPPLIVIATRYAQEIVRLRNSADGCDRPNFDHARSGCRYV